MNNLNRKPPEPVRALQNGQTWEMSDSSLQIERVGKGQIHYRLFKRNAKEAATSISDIKVVETFLMVKRAVLAPE